MSEESSADRNVEIWKIKKLIKSLEMARGNGTSMISLIIPPKDQISRVSKMLADEFGTASNIKSRVNRLSVLGAITSVQHRLKLYTKVPPNGLVIYCGTIVTEEGKEKKVNIDFEPFKPINTSLYLCDNKFHTEALTALLADDNKFGFIVMDGNGALFGTLQGNTREVLHKFTVDLPKKHGRGGQSALRFARLRMEKRHNYVRKVAEVATQLFISADRPNVAGLILAGSADFKTELSQSDMFDPRLQSKIIKLVDVSYGGENGFNQAIELAAESLQNVKFIQEKKLIGRYFDEISQIMDISVAPNTCASLNHMNRKQFYSALKLIAAHQTNMTVKPELLFTPLDLPLPRFTWTLNSDANADLIQLSNSPKEQHISKRERNFGGNLGAYEPIRVSSNLSDSDVPQSLSHDATEALSTDSEMESETLSQRSGSLGRRVKAGSPWSTASESPTPTNSVAERVHPVWEHSVTGRGVWPTNTAEEHTRLLGTEEESSDRHSSEEEGEEGDSGEEIFAISEVQARHYAAQFAQLRPERGLLSGQTARLFFEKSRLSVPDLRKIWLLSDITKDGMLTLEEFSIAMHLIVLRRNSIPVPDVLPACLVPKVDSHFSQQAVTTDLVDLGSDMFGSGTSADFNFAPKPEVNDPYESKPVKKSEERQPSLSPPKPEPQVNNKEWTKFVDSPTSSVSSPGPKPVNFDFHKSALERDPKIFHPVALRVTPDANTLPHDGDLRSSTSPRRDDFAHAFELASPKRLNSQPPPDQPPNGTSEIKSIQRPQPKKPVKNAGVLPPPPARESSVHADEGPQSLQYAPKKDPPPPPPPRPLRNHTRSSSLDLNRFKGVPAPPPQPPPRMSPSATSPPTRRLVNQRSEGEPAFPPDAFAPREYEGEGFGYNREDAPKMHGAFEVYRKPSRESSCEADPDIKSLQDQNAVLHRVCRALCAELADVQREREGLRVRLDTNSTPV